MQEQQPEDLTELIRRASAGDEEAAARVLDATYAELRRHGRMLMRSQAPWHTLEADALLNEAYLKVARNGKEDWESRGHFIAVMSRAMRQHLIDYGKRKQAAKRGGDARRVPLSGLLIPFQDRAVDLLTLHEALERLAEIDPGAARVVDLKFFVGLSMSEVAQSLDIHERTATREWTFASTWLRGEVQR